jgi:hypothetical protein
MQNDSENSRLSSVCYLNGTMFNTGPQEKADTDSQYRLLIAYYKAHVLDVSEGRDESTFTVSLGKTKMFTMSRHNEADWNMLHDASKRIQLIDLEERLILKEDNLQEAEPHSPLSSS